MPWLLILLGIPVMLIIGRGMTWGVFMLSLSGLLVGMWWLPVIVLIEAVVAECIRGEKT